jgi:hypothetical protein
VPVDPHRGGPGKLPLLAPVDCLDRIAELEARPSLDLDERHRPVAFCDQIDVTVPVPKSPLQYAPPVVSKPSLRHSLSYFAEFLPRR